MTRTVSRRPQLLATLALLWLAGCTPAREPLPHQAYVWQRIWTDAVAAAVDDRRIGWQALRVLAWQLDDRQAHAARVDPAVLARRGLPVRVVLRLEGHRPRLSAGEVATRAAETLQHWHAAGVLVDGIEIDHDCASAALADYAAWLRELRAALPAGTLLSVTALPTWLGSPHLRALRAAADETVLQVHAIDARSGTLFDAERAAGWVQDWATVAPQPFLVALPAYGLRVRQDTAGKALLVDAEGAIDRSGAAGREWRAAPSDVARLVTLLQQRPPAALRGLVWFRLPVTGDRRAWRQSTLAAVIDGEPLAARLVVEAEAVDGELHDLYLHNRGNLDVVLPATVAISTSCKAGDGLLGYRWDSATGSMRHSTDAASRPWLMAGERRSIGWLRCGTTPAGHAARP